MGIGVIGQAMACLQNAPTHCDIAAQLYRARLHATQILPHLKKHGGDFMLFQNRQNTICVAIVGAIIKGQHQGFLGQCRAKNFVSFGFRFRSRFAPRVV